MIAKDQPKIFKDTNLIVRVSSVSDGQMVVERAGKGVAINNIDTFVENPKHALLKCTYDRDSFNEIQIIDGTSTLWDSKPSNRYNADAFVTNTTNVALSIPVADCLCLVIFDPITQTLGIAHLGRHGTVDNLTEKLISVMEEQYDCNTRNLLCYLSPSIKFESYGLDYFDKVDDQQWRSLYKVQDDKIFIDIPGYNVRKLLERGILESNIEISRIDTAKNENYGSHYINERNKAKSNFRFLVSATIENPDA